MDDAVSSVQAFLRRRGCLTATELPVVRAARAGGYESLTDRDVPAFRFGKAPGPHEPEDPRTARAGSELLGISAAQTYMLMGEVKEGRAEPNASATRHDVLSAALGRSGCCHPGGVDDVVGDLLRHGKTRTRHDHAVRLVAFGALPPGRRDRRCHVILLGDVVAHLRGYVRRPWDVLQASASEGPGFGVLMTLEKADRGQRGSGRAASSGPGPRGGAPPSAS